MNEEEILNNVDLEGAEPTPDTEHVDEVPTMSDPGWSDYVISQFTKDELDDNGNPYVHGLRRVARKLLGPIVYSGSRTIDAPSFISEGNPNLTPAVQEYTVKFWWTRDAELPEGYLCEFTDVADCHMGNTDPIFARFASPVAATRAEGRVLRKALQLKRVIAAEEGAPPLQENKFINDYQMTFIDSLSKRSDINVLKVLNFGKTKFSDITQIPFETAVKMTEYISKLQKSPKLVEENNFKGYDPNWRNS